MWWWLILALAAVASWAQWKRRRLLQLAAKMPGPPTLPLLGNALYFMCGQEEMLGKLSQLVYKYGDVSRFWLGPDLNVLITKPEDLEAVLTSTKILSKGPVYKYMKTFIGEGLLSGSGPTWKHHRKLVNPAFGKDYLERFNVIFNEETDRLLIDLGNKDNEKEFNVLKDVLETTTNSVIRTLLCLSEREMENLPLRNNILKETERIYDIIYLRMTKWWYQIEWLFRFTKLYKDQERLKQDIDIFSKEVVKRRLTALETQIDHDDSSWCGPLDRLLRSGSLSRREMYHETFTLFTSSQESSAKITSFVLLMMAQHPEYQEKVYAEIRDVIGDEDRHVTKEDFKYMPILDIVVKECLRLFPIGSLLQRVVTVETELSSCTLPAGCSLVIPIYQLHRDPRRWDNPDAFMPERFLPENSTGRHPYTYIPFSAGLMNCIGQSFAYLLIKTISSRVIYKYAFTSRVPYSQLQLTTDISVRPKHGHQVFVRPRKKN